MLLNALKSDEKLLPAEDASLGNTSLSNSRYAPLGSVANPLRYFWLVRPQKVAEPDNTAINSFQLTSPEAVSADVAPAISND